VAVDETGFSHGFIHPRKQWQRRGCTQRLSRLTAFERCSKTVTCVVSCKAIIHYEWARQPMNSLRFASFLRTALIGYTGYWLILDNVAFHKTELVRSTLESLGVTPIYIDPYTPQQNPIEEVFAMVKAHVRKKGPRCTRSFDSSLRQAMCRPIQRTLTGCFHRAVSFTGLD
jgi:transposase